MEVLCGEDVLVDMGDGVAEGFVEVDHGVVEEEEREQHALARRGHERGTHAAQGRRARVCHDAGTHVRCRALAVSPAPPASSIFSSVCIFRGK